MMILFDKRCSITLLCLLALFVGFTMIYLNQSSDMYKFKRFQFTMRTLVEVKTNNVSEYIKHVLQSISDPEKKEKEKQMFLEYLRWRNQFIQLLPRLTKQNKATNFHVLVDKVKRNVGARFDLVILVSSYSLHRERRRNIRKYWGNRATSLNKNWLLVFMTGGVNNSRQMTELYDEAVRERDIIIEDFPESWSLNMGKKVMSGLQWVNANLKYDFVLKTDDDVFTDVDGVIAKLKKVDDDLVYMGNRMEGSEVLRSGRYGVPNDEYPASVYEPYCSGGGFVLSETLIRRMIPIFQWEHPLRIDDAYFGGRVIKAGGQATHDEGFYMWNGECRYYSGLLVTHPANEECLKKMNDIVLEKKKHYVK